MSLRKFEQGQNLRSEVAIRKFPIRFFCALGVSAALLAFLPRFVSFLPKFRNVAETPSSGMGVLGKVSLVGKLIWHRGNVRV